MGRTYLSWCDLVLVHGHSSRSEVERLANRVGYAWRACCVPIREAESYEALNTQRRRRCRTDQQGIRARLTAAIADLLPPTCLRSG
jgi:hypothetical protein